MCKHTQQDMQITVVASELHKPGLPKMTLSRLRRSAALKLCWSPTDAWSWPSLLFYTEDKNSSSWIFPFPCLLIYTALLKAFKCYWKWKKKTSSLRSEKDRKHIFVCFVASFFVLKCHWPRRWGIRKVFIRLYILLQCPKQFRGHIFFQ